VFIDPLDALLAASDALLAASSAAADWCSAAIYKNDGKPGNPRRAGDNK
jgi:hypothetical protein